MATQADYLRVLRSGPMPITQLFREIYPHIGSKSQGASNWSLERLIDKEKVWIVRIGFDLTTYKHVADPMRSRARTWVLLSEDAERLVERGVLIDKSVEFWGMRDLPRARRFGLVPGRSFSACALCGGHETEGLHRSQQFGVVHKECES